MIWIILLVALSGSGLYFHTHWHKRWFKIVWCILMLMLIGQILRTH
jgi:hypothetical protein